MPEKHNSIGHVHPGAVQFIVAEHFVSASAEVVGYPVFSDNDSYHVASGDGSVHLVRAMLMTSTASRFEILDASSGSYPAVVTTESINSFGATNADGTFKLILSSSVGTPSPQMKARPE